MRIVYMKTLQMNPMHIMRKAGYNHFIDPNTKEESYVLRTGPDFYPRFHVYIIEEGETIGIDLHLDQKKAQYKGSRAHNGEYDGPTVERELARIAGWVKSMYGALPTRSDALEATFQPKPEIRPASTEDNPHYEKPPTPPPDDQKPSLFGGIF